MEQTSPLSDPSNPIPINKGAGKHKKYLIIGSIIAVVLLIAAGLFFLFQQRSQDGLEQPFGDLPSQEIPLATQPTPAREQPTEAKTAPAVPTPSPLPPIPLEEQRQAANLGVLVSYSQEPRFTFNIETIERTNARTTIEFFRPREGEPYSTIQVISDQGQTLFEDRFTVGTSFHGETTTEGKTQYTGVVGLPRSDIYLVLPLPPGQRVAQVQVVSSEGTILDERDFADPAAQSSENVVSILGKIQRWLAHLAVIPAAQAQADGILTIVVINELGGAGALTRISNIVQTDMLAIEPFASYNAQGAIDVQAVFNNEDLGCIIVDNIPACPSTGRIIQVVSRHVPNWDTIIVAHPFGCWCGSVLSSFPPVATVGAESDATVPAHELGHSIGHMGDEYYYLLDGFPIKQDVPNCFESDKACQVAITRFPGAVCSPGCEQVDEWRPATRIMHAERVTQYGPVEECILRQAIAAIIGVEVSCFDDGEGTPLPSPFWGWYR
jgi:hypothetical protein